MPTGNQSITASPNPPVSPSNEPVARLQTVDEFAGRLRDSRGREVVEVMQKLDPRLRAVPSWSSEHLLHCTQDPNSCGTWGEYRTAPFMKGSFSSDLSAIKISRRTVSTKDRTADRVAHR